MPQYTVFRHCCRSQCLGIFVKQTVMPHTKSDHNIQVRLRLVQKLCLQDRITHIHTDTFAAFRDADRCLLLCSGFTADTIHLKAMSAQDICQDTAFFQQSDTVAFDRDTNKIKAIGEDARLMLGRTPGNIVAVRPLRQGVISDYTVTEKMMKYFIQKALGKRTFRKPRIAVCVPSGVTEVEKKAVEDATYQAGAREVSIIEEPIAAAFGAGIDISKPCGNMIVDIGGGTSDIAVISLGGVPLPQSAKY